MFLGVLTFALLRLFTAKLSDDNSVKSLNKGLLFTIGVLIGVFAITLGIGGSILLTPILAGFLLYPIKKAVSAGLFFVAFSSVAGLFSHLNAGTIDLEKGLYVATASLLGVFIGIWLKDKVSSDKHKMYLLIMYVVAMVLLMKKMFLG
jgi:uncharacterized membrane protein YfcA